MNLDFYSEVDPSLLAPIRDTLQRNVGLKSIKFTGIAMFFEDLRPKISFKLTNFKIYFYPGHREAENNLDLFLQSQKDSIESLSLGMWVSSELLSTVLSMPRLEEFKFMNGLNEFEITTALPQSNSVKNLDLYIYGANNDVLTNFLLPFFPKTEILEIKRMTRETAELIPTSCKFLKHLIVDNYEADRVSNKAFYLSLETFTTNYCENQNSKKMFLKLNGKFAHKN